MGGISPKMVAWGWRADIKPHTVPSFVGVAQHHARTSLLMEACRLGGSGGCGQGSLRKGILDSFLPRGPLSDLPPSKAGVTDPNADKGQVCNLWELRSWSGGGGVFSKGK